ncbi:MAG: hypothetical protein ACLQFR_09580 [Streptosporangiaceae bacterium]
MRKTAVAVTTTALVSLSGAVVAVPAQAATSTARPCPANWGTGPRHAGQMVQTNVRDVRAGRHLCFDRLVIDLGPGQKPGYRVRYVRVFVTQGSGMVVHASGHAKLLVTVLAPAASSFPANKRHLVRVAGFGEFRQIVGLGSFEGITSIGIGLRAKKPFRVLELTGSGHRVRLIIDVARRG